MLNEVKSPPKAGSGGLNETKSQPEVVSGGNKKSDRLFISGIIIFLVSLAAINITTWFPVRIIFAIGCFVGTIIVIFLGKGPNHPALWARAVWVIALPAFTFPVINIFVCLFIDHYHTLPKHIGYFAGIKNNFHTVDIFLFWFILSEIYTKLNKKKK
ncbi:MAG: hypothetical protein PHX21_09435 [bacterium]|nr:hypothetical protein [bacterium]